MDIERATAAASAEAWVHLVEQIYAARARQVWDYARRLGLDSGAAEEAMQEAFARLLSLSSLRRPSNPESWLFRVAHNLAMDTHRRTRPSPVRELAMEPVTRDDGERVALWQAVDRLPERQRAAVYLRYSADLDYSAIAAILGISESGARANVFRGIAALRAVITEERA